MNQLYRPKWNLTLYIPKVTSENPWERGRLARIFLKNAGMMPAYPAKNVVFGGCHKITHGKKRIPAHSILEL